MPKADFETNDVIQPGTFDIADNEGVMQANVTYIATALGDNVLGAGGETGSVVKYQRDYTKGSERAADTESPRLYNDREGTEQRGQERHMLTRAVASSAMDKMIGLNALAEEKFGVDDTGRVFGASVIADGAGVQSNFQLNPGEAKVACVLQADYKNPTIQRGLSDLEVSDYISGQLDRHTGNIFVDPESGKVTGIDNDLAFPEVEREALMQREMTSWGATDNKAVAGFPRQMHEETKAKILAVSPDELRQTLGAIVAPDATETQPGRLSEAEIDGACQRLEALQAELRSPDCSIQVVPQFNDATYDSAVAAQKASFDKVAWKGADAGQTFDTCTAGAICDLVPKTSYLGAVALKEKQTAVFVATAQQANVQRQAEGLPVQPLPAGVRPANTAPKAPRNEQYAEFAQQAEIAKQTLKANPSLIENPADRKQVTDLKQQMAEVKAKIAHYDKETAKLDEGKLGAKFRSLASGGTEGRKEFYADKKVAAQQQLAGLDRQLDAAAANAVPVAMKQGLMDDAAAVVAAKQVAPVVAQNNVAAQNAPLTPPNYPAPQPPGADVNVAAQNGLPSPPNYPAPQPPGADVNVAAQNGLPSPPNYPAPQPPGADVNVAAQNGLPSPPNYPAPQPPGAEVNVAAQNGLPSPPNYPAPQPPGADVNVAAQNGLPSPPNYPAPQPPGADVNVAAQNGLPSPPNYPAPQPPGVEQPDNVAGNGVEAKKPALEKKTSVADMLKRTNSAPQLGGNKEAQAVGGEEPKPGGKSLRASGGWQSAKPSTPKPAGGSISASHP